MCHDRAVGESRKQAIEGHENKEGKVEVAFFVSPANDVGSRWKMPVNRILFSASDMKSSPKQA
jgi:hypothetical protein